MTKAGHQKCMRRKGSKLDISQNWHVFAFKRHTQWVKDTMNYEGQKQTYGI